MFASVHERTQTGERTYPVLQKIDCFFFDFLELYKVSFLQVDTHIGGHRPHSSVKTTLGVLVDEHVHMGNWRVCSMFTVHTVITFCVVN